jgi:cytochrome c peroxidase
MLPYKINIALGLLIVSWLTGCQNAPTTDKGSELTQAELGRLLFFDPNLSQNRQQSCATCHNPAEGFVDTRRDDNGEIRPVSLGTDEHSLGTRNAPTVTYAAFAPDFQWGKHQRFNSQQPDYEGYLGGQFHDGRAKDLAEQAGGPPLNPVEMQMPGKGFVVERLQENPLYLKAFKRFYGTEVFEQPDRAFTAMTKAIEAFEKTPEVSPFDAKYDRVLRGEAEFSFKERSGKALFFSQQFTNCATCHQAKPNGHARETFTHFEYHNIGVPANPDLALDAPDPGLLANPAVDDPAHRGKFKVPTLRNVAVTGPYMHNGVFRDLRTVVEFYDHFLMGSVHTENPETHQAWSKPEVSDTVAETELKDGRKLKPIQVEQLVCFLRTLTDQRYEHLIEENGIQCADPE